MPEIDDLLRDFRADVPPPGEGAPERIVERAFCARPQADHATTPARRRPRWRSPARLGFAGACLAAAITLALALALDDTTGPSDLALLERAEAAVTPREQILVLDIRLRSTSNDPAVVPRDRVRDIRWRESVLAGRGDAVAIRTTITEGPVDDPPTDEDTTMRFDSAGRVVETRSWTDGVLSVQTKLPDQRLGDAVQSLSGVLRSAYENRVLRQVGSADGGKLRLRGHLLDGGCGRTDVLLDSVTFIPERLEVESRLRSGRGCDPRGPVVERQRWVISSHSVDVTERNGRLLEIGDWPVDRYELNGKQVDRAQIPPAPPLPASG